MLARAGPKLHPKAVDWLVPHAPSRERYLLFPVLNRTTREGILAKRGPDLVDPRLAKALEHPIRAEILNVLRDGPSGPARIQRQLQNVSLNLVSHHIKVLAELGCVELVETVNKRGAKEHIYEAVGPFVLSDEAWAQATPKLRQPITSTILRLISDDLAKSLGAGKFDELLDNHLSRTPLELDEQGWSEITDVLARTLDEVMEIGSGSRKRIKAGEGPGLPATVAILQFPNAGS